jgi:O-antigen/teichoic acid export membrane protein
MSSTSDTAQRTIVRGGYIWNSASGMINAVQSLIILIFITRFVGIEEAGIFSIAYAVGGLLQMFATYGVGNFQITDIKEKYSFSDYFWNRSITVLASLALLSVYCALKTACGDYSSEKMLIVLLIGAWKLIDSMENVFYAMFQQKGRLDIGAKCYTIRMTVSMILYCALLALRVDFTASTAVTFVFSVVFAFLLVKKNFLYSV